MIIWLPSTVIKTGSSMTRPVESIVVGHIGRPVNAGRLIALGLFIAAVTTVVGSGIKASAQQNQGTAVQPPSHGNAVTFEVASVKVNKSGALAMPSATKGRTYRAT